MERHVLIVDDEPDMGALIAAGLRAVGGATRAGAYDFVQKPIKIETLQLTVERALRHHALTAEVKRLRDVVLPPAFEGIVGQSAPMRQLFDLVARVAPTEASV